MKATEHKRFYVTLSEQDIMELTGMEVWLTRENRQDVGPALRERWAKTIKDMLEKYAASKEDQTRMGNLAEELYIALSEALKLLAFHTKILNKYDGGQREFQAASSPESWLKRLRHVGKLPKKEYGDVVGNETKTKNGGK